MGHKHVSCAYRGKPGAQTLDHVVPRCLYASGLVNKKVQRLKVPACAQCNNTWSADEPTLRNLLVAAATSEDAAGTPRQNPIAEDLTERIVRSMTTAKYADKERRRMFSSCLGDLKTKRVGIYPGGMAGGGDGPLSDRGVLRVVRKIVRGFYYRKTSTQIADNRVLTLIDDRGRILESVKDECEYGHQDPNVFEYWWCSFDGSVCESFWGIRFFKTVPFASFITPPGTPASLRMLWAEV